MELEHFIEKVDINKNGSIDYSEFIIAAMSKDKLINDEQTRKAFLFFDKNHTGKI